MLQQLQESQARLAKAEAELAEAAGKLRAWSEAGNHGPLDTVMGQDIEKAVVPDPHLLAVEMVNGTPNPAPWGNLKDGAPPMPPSLPWSTPDWDNYLPLWRTYTIILKVSPPGRLVRRR